MQTKNPESPDSRLGRKKMTAGPFVPSLFLDSRLALLEALYTSALVENFFLAGKERVARTTDLDIYFGHGRAHGEFVAARTRDFRLRVVCWVDFFLHR